MSETVLARVTIRVYARNHNALPHAALDSFRALRAVCSVVKGTMGGQSARQSTLDLSRDGRRITVRKNDTHPDNYLFIDIDGHTFFLGVVTPGMTRRQVRQMALAWLRARD